MTGHPITEDDLHGYVDGLIDSTRRAEVAAYLQDHPDVATRTASYAKQRDTLRAAMAPIAEEPIPLRLNIARMIEARRGRQMSKWVASVAAALLIFIGGAAGWSLRSAVQPASEGVLALAQEAADSYGVYAPDRVRPVEIRAAEGKELVSWASQRLQRSVTVPDLASSGYRFMGGRLLSTPHGPAVMFMYDDDRGTRLVVLTRAMTVDQNMPMVPHTRGAVNGFAWADKGVGYSLVGPAAPDVLHSIADSVRDQVKRGI
jgi:anti-sigma factor RsiW